MALSQFFVGDQTLSDTLNRVAHLANQTLPGSDMAGITMLADGRPATAVFTDETAVEIARAQSTRLESAPASMGVDLRTAMQSRAVIEQAKGMLTATQRCSADEAFQILMRASQRDNRKLRQMAEELVNKNQWRSEPGRSSWAKLHGAPPKLVLDVTLIGFSGIEAIPDHPFHVSRHQERRVLGFRHGAGGRAGGGAVAVVDKSDPGALCGGLPRAGRRGTVRGWTSKPLPS